MATDTKEKVPGYCDSVKHIKTEVTGTVIAIFMLNGINHLDVRGDDGRIYYNTPAANWMTVKTEEERVE